MTKRKTAAERAAETLGRELTKNLTADTGVTIGDDIEDEEADALESLASVGEGSEIKFILARVAPIDRKGTLEELGRDEIPTLETYVRETYGPGKYSVHARAGSRYVKGSHRLIVVSPDAKRPGGTPAAAGSSPQTDLERFRLEVDQRRLEDERRAERLRQERREDMKFYAPLLITLLNGVTGNRESLGSMIQAMGGLQGLAGGTANEQQLVMFQKGLELAAKLNGKEPETVIGLIREAIKEVGPMARALVAPRAGAPLIVHDAPAGAPGQTSAGAAAGTPAGQAAPSSSPAPEQTSQQPDMQQMFIARIAQELLENAIAGVEATLAAEVIAQKIWMPLRNMVPDGVLREELQKPEWIEQLVAARPDLANYRPYIEQVKAIFLAGLEPDSSEEAPTG